MWNNTKKSNIRIIRVSEGERKEYAVKILFEEIMGKYFSDLVRDINILIQKAQWTLNKINPKESMPRHIVIKRLKTKTKKKLL